MFVDPQRKCSLRRILANNKIVEVSSNLFWRLRGTKRLKRSQQALIGLIGRRTTTSDFTAIEDIAICTFI